MAGFTKSGKSKLIFARFDPLFFQMLRD